MKQAGNRQSAAVIGSGIGGAAIAALLSHRGYEVTVLERLGFTGGRCCSHDREGFVLIVSNADPNTTIVQMAGKEHFPREYVEQVGSLEYTAGAHLVKLALDKKITDEKFIMQIGHPVPSEYYRAIDEGVIPEGINLMIPVISNMDPSTAPEGCQLIIAGTLQARSSDEEAWRASLMSAVKKIFPGLEDHLIFVEETTVNSVSKMMGERGSVIGMAQTTEQIGARRLKQKTPLPQLYLVGAEAGGWGIGTELAATSALELIDLIQ